MARSPRNKFPFLPTSPIATSCLGAAQLLMPVIRVRSLVKRSVADTAGGNIQKWISSCTPTSVFIVTLVFAFFVIFWILGTIWKIVRKCRMPTSDGWREIERKKYQQPSAQNGPNAPGPSRPPSYNPAASYDDNPHGLTLGRNPARATYRPPDARTPQRNTMTSNPQRNTMSSQMTSDEPAYLPDEEKEETAPLVQPTGTTPPMHGRQGSGSNLRPLNLVQGQRAESDVPSIVRDRVANWTTSTWWSSVELSRSISRKLTGKGGRKDAPQASQ